MELDGLLSALEERANTARTIFMLLDSDADGLVAVEQLGSMLTSMLLSQSLNYEGDVEEFVLHFAEFLLHLFDIKLLRRQFLLQRHHILFGRHRGPRHSDLHY